MIHLVAERVRPRRGGGFVAWVAALALAPLLAGTVRAVGNDGIYYSRDPADDGAYFSSQTAFRIPFQADQTERRIQEVALHVSMNFGKTYQKVATAAPGDKEFRFEARQDGWYWFTVQTRDDLGRFYPPDLSLAQPALKVCVDSKAPTATLRWLPARDGQVGVEWDVIDPNLDVAAMRLEYRAVGAAEWIPLPFHQAASGQYSWNPGTNAPVEAHLLVRDKALNSFEARTPSSGGSFKPGPPALGAVGPAPNPTPSNVVMVNKRRVQLNFKIDDVGSSKVKAVEVWYTSDSRDWRKTPEDAGAEPPYVVDLPGEGRYGLTLIARSGVGLGEPTPRPGDPPQVWVEVDETKPDVKLLGVDVGRGVDSGNLTVRWTARDKHLAAQPITLSYAENPAGQWTTMAASLPNTEGRYVWRMPENMPPLIYVRVEAVDQAGNVGSDDTAKPVSTDLSIPKCRVIDIKAAPAKTP